MLPNPGTTVDSDEAFSVLGVEAPTSAEAIRRAYLRLVRKHSPERDPEGFQRVREAYDLLRDAPWLWGEPLEATSPISTPIPAPPAPSTPTERATEEIPEPTPDKRTAEEELWNALSLIPDEEPTGPVPWLEVENTLQLLEDGKLAEARRLSQSLDRRVTELGIGAREIGPDVIARWMLVTELLALEQVVSEKWIRALAAGVRSGDFAKAARLHKKGAWRLRRALAAKAPRVNKALVAQAAVPSFRPGLTGWSWLWVGWLGIYLTRACVNSVFEAEQHPQSTQAAATSNSANGQQEGLDAAARAIDEALQHGDCNTVRKQWPVYARGVRDDGFAWSHEIYPKRRAQALARCTELTGELTETP